jgi:hypothetical protein
MIKRLGSKRVRLIPGRNEGQSLLLFAIMLPLILLFVAFVVDGAHAFVDYRHLQNAADASSLAAAQDLATSGCDSSQSQQDKCVQQEVTDYAFQNGEWPNDSSAGVGHLIQACVTPAGVDVGVQSPIGPSPGDVQACYQWPYNGTDPTRVLVKIRDCTATLIGQYFGVPKICSSVRSVSISSPQVTTSVVTNPPIDPSTLYSTSTGTTVIHGSESVFTNTTSTVINGSTSTYTTTGTTTIQGTTGPFTSTITTVVPGTTLFSNSVSTTTTPGSDALFANDSTCDATHGIVIGDPGNGPGAGNSAKIVGNAYSNGSININGNTQTHVTKAIYKSSPAACKGFPDKKVDSSVTDNGTLPWLQTWDGPSICQSAPAGQTSANAIVINAGSHASGIWCSDTSITVQGNGTDSMNVTLIAPQIHVPAQNITFTPAVQGLLFYLTCGNGAPIPACVTDDNQPGSSCTLSTGNATPWPQVTFCYSPNNANQAGDIWIPHGTIAVAGNSGPSGLWQAQDVIVLGNSFTLTGTGGGTTTTSTTAVPTTTIPTTITNLSTGTTTTPNTTSTSTVTVTSTAPNTTSTSYSTGTVTGPDTTSTSESTNTIIIPGTSGSVTTTVKTTGTNLALNQ